MRIGVERVRLVVWLLAALVAGACTVPSVGPAPPPVEVLGALPQAFQFGRSAEDILGHADLGPKIQKLFGADWTATAAAGGGTTTPATEFFGKSDTPRVLRIGDREYVAVSGCAPRACGTHRGLLLIHGDGDHMRARLDEAGFSHYYGFGVGEIMDAVTRAFVDGAWNAVDGAR